VAGRRPRLHRARAAHQRRRGALLVQAAQVGGVMLRIQVVK